MSRDEWWFDYVEGDIDEQTRKEMKSVLRSSPADQDLVKSISDTKTLIKESDAEDLFSDAQLDALHDKIMAGIEETEIKPKPRFEVPKLLLRKHAKNVTVGLGLVMSLLIVKIVSHKTPTNVWDVTNQMVEDSQNHPDEVSQMMTYQNETDFFVDVASQSLDHLTKEQFESLFKSSKIR